MVDQDTINKLMIEALESTTGLLKAVLLSDESRREILEIESDAEKRSLMGLGKVTNAGVREVMGSDLVYAALTDMDFSWGNDPSLILKKGPEVVGLEVRDEETIEALKQQENVWFLHKNFVIYKDRIQFPQDIMQKVCQFEIPGLPANWCVLEDNPFKSIICAFPCTPSDVFLKEHCFQTDDLQGQGTVLIGATLKT